MTDFPARRPAPPRTAGRRLRLSVPRRLVCDFLHFARRVPSVPVQRGLDLGALAEARRGAAKRLSWAVLFARAFGLVAAEVPALRRTYLPFPVPHLYEHPDSTAGVAVERDYLGESGVFFGLLRGVEHATLAEMQERLDWFRSAPLADVGSFRATLAVSRLPWPLRRLVWWGVLNLSGALRARRLGTFGVSVYSSLGAESLHPISPLTTLLTYGPIAPGGAVTVRVVYDHRVLDGATVARALARLEEVLLGPVAAEVRAAAAPRAA
jgi:hypothetical protein